MGCYEGKKDESFRKAFIWKGIEPWFGATEDNHSAVAKHFEMAIV